MTTSPDAARGLRAGVSQVQLSQQQLAAQDWAANWDRVANTPDLASCISQELWRARSFAAHAIQREHLKAQRGQPWDRHLVASYQADLEGIETQLRMRGEIGRQLDTACVESDAEEPQDQSQAPRG